MKKIVIVSLAMGFLMPSVFAAPATNLPSKPESSLQTNAKININTADQNALAAIKGLGEKKALAIVKYRSDHGQFTNLHDLTKVPGIGEKLLAAIQSQLSV